jgi:hypothetical protein
MSKGAMPSALPYNFHDGVLAAVEVGPRREVTLAVGLDTVWNAGERAARVRFGGIENFDEVRAFFATLAPARLPGAFLDRIDFLNYDPAEVSRVQRLVLRLELDYGGTVAIR